MRQDFTLCVMHVCIAVGELGYHVSGMDVLGRWACCLADIPTRTRPMGSAAGNHQQVSLSVYIDLYRHSSCFTPNTTTTRS